MPIAARTSLNLKLKPSTPCSSSPPGFLEVLPWSLSDPILFIIFIIAYYSSPLTCSYDFGWRERKQPAIPKYLDFYLILIRKSLRRIFNYFNIFFFAIARIFFIFPDLPLT